MYYLAFNILVEQYNEIAWKVIEGEVVRASISSVYTLDRFLLNTLSLIYQK